MTKENCKSKKTEKSMKLADKKTHKHINIRENKRLTKLPNNQGKERKEEQKKRSGEKNENELGRKEGGKDCNGGRSEEDSASVTYVGNYCWEGGKKIEEEKEEKRRSRKTRKMRRKRRLRKRSRRKIIMMMYNKMVSNQRGRPRKDMKKRG